ncbi:MAG TPA: AAA family ATPase [Chloroflexota bacterium]
MSELSSVVIIGNDPIVLRLPARLQAEQINTFVARSATELESYLRRVSRVVAVVDGDLSPEQMDTFRAVLRSGAAIPTLTIFSPEGYGRLGASSNCSAEEETAPKPSRVEELVLRVKALILRAGHELPEFQPAATANRDSTGGFRTGKVVSVFAAKGGVGKSTVAANLAVGLAQFYPYRVMLIDTNLWFGEIGFLLDINSKKSLFDLCAGGDPDASSLLQSVVRHPSGVQVLLRPKDLVSVEKLELGALNKVMAVARTVFDFIVVDMPTSMDEMTLQILDSADQIVVITTPEIGAIANTSRFVTIADDLGYKDRLLLVVNRANSGIDTRAIERALDVKVECTVMSAGIQVVQAANEGLPIFTKYSEETQLARDLMSIVEKVAGRPRPQVEEILPRKKTRLGGPLFVNLLERRAHR